eukprot:1119809-Pleurochrysis_carterae.AAC.2
MTGHKAVHSSCQWPIAAALEAARSLGLYCNFPLMLFMVSGAGIRHRRAGGRLGAEAIVFGESRGSRRNGGTAAAQRTRAGEKEI